MSARQRMGRSSRAASSLVKLPMSKFSSSNLCCTSFPSALHILSARYASSINSPSSSRYMARHQGDSYVKARNQASEGEDPYVARSAFKLIELHKMYKRRLLWKGMAVVDLGAAPGGWVQVLSKVGIAKEGGRRGTIVALDLLPLDQRVSSLPGVRFIQGDFLNPVVQLNLREELRLRSLNEDGKADLVLSDMMGNMTGNPVRDGQISMDLCEAALSFAVKNLRATDDDKDRVMGKNSQNRDSVRLVLKCFQSVLTNDFKKKLEVHFGMVVWLKPASSRDESREGFWICGALKSKDNPDGDMKASKKTGVVADVNDEDSLYF